MTMRHSFQPPHSATISKAKANHKFPKSRVRLNTGTVQLERMRFVLKHFLNDKKCNTNDGH